MIQRIYRILFVLFIAAGTARVYAQAAPASDFGVWILNTELEETTVGDPEGDVTLDFDSDLGYGISFNHFWTERFSTELSLQQFSAEGTAEFDGDEFDLGELEARSLTAMAQWHFNRAGRFAPYVGGGISRLTGEVDAIGLDEDEEETFDLEDELSWSAAVGANIRLNDHFFISGELKYTPWGAIAEDDPEDEAVDLDPLVFAAGVKFRF